MPVSWCFSEKEPTVVGRLAKLFFGFEFQLDVNS
jgi:hypothetical protein